VDLLNQHLLILVLVTFSSEVELMIPKRVVQKVDY
jgi:hypothetical protein